MSTGKTRSPSMRIVTEMSELARALSSFHRLLLLEHILEGEKSVETLAELSGLSVANTSQHLQQMRRAGLVLTRRESKHIYYRLGVGPIRDIVKALRKQAEFKHSQTEILFTRDGSQASGVETISREELLRRMRDGEIRVVDVRSPGEFETGHLPNALNIPFVEMENRLPDLSAGKEIVTYCRGPFCVLSVNAANLLRSRGYRVRHYEGGFREWKETGQPVETGKGLGAGRRRSTKH